METFQFYQDSKQTIWNRVKFTVKADSYDAAVEMLKPLISEDIGNVTEDFFEIDEGETLYDTAENLTIENNQGFSTLELYNSKGELISCNGQE